MLNTNVLDIKLGYPLGFDHLSLPLPEKEEKENEGLLAGLMFWAQYCL